MSVLITLIKKYSIYIRLVSIDTVLLRLMLASRMSPFSACAHPMLLPAGEADEIHL